MPFKDKSKRKKYWHKRYAEFRKYLDAYKLEKGCTDCGYKDHPAGLEFDHRPGELKKGCVTSMVGKGWGTIKAEIAKCDVVCGTCHNIRTWNRSESKKYY